MTGGNGIDRDAIGSRVYLTTDDGRTLMQEVKSGSSLGAGNDTALHFGLGDAEIDEVMVIWSDGNQNFYPDVTPNQIWEAEYLGLTK